MEGVSDLSEIPSLLWSCPAAYLRTFFPWCPVMLGGEQEKVLRNPVLVSFTIEPISRVAGGHCD